MTSKSGQKNTPNYTRKKNDRKTLREIVFLEHPDKYANIKRSLICAFDAAGFSLHKTVSCTQYESGKCSTGTKTEDNVFHVESFISIPLSTNGIE